jgi:hypothetical protein
MDVLCERGYLEYGILIPRQEFEQLFGVSYIEGDWSFLGPLLSMQVYLMERGYLCTQEGIKAGCLRIYDCDEIADKSDRMFKNMVSSLKRLQACLLNTRSQEFNNQDFKKHMHATNKINTALHSMKSKLLNT